jgi:DUF177 domain-containing protein
VTLFNVVGLLREPSGVTRRHLLRDHYQVLGPDVELAGPLNGELRLQRTNRGVLVSGEASAPVRRVCARCLDPFVEEARVTVSEEYVPVIDPETGQPVDALVEGEGVQPINEHHEIDLAPVLHDEFALTEPMHPLCRPDCPGLCPECGLRLGEGHQAHEVEEIDPRLAGLAALLGGDEPTH